MLMEEVANAQRSVRTDAFQMSIGEIVSMYERREIVIDPEFQRLFRWDLSQKSRLIESILLGIPLPSIFVFELGDGTWELVDGLQRLSTILEFMGILRDADGNIATPSILEATKYLPSLSGAVWETSDRIIDVPVEEQRALDRASQLAIRRSRLSVEILKRPSDDLTKYDLFQRLNSGGTQANPQEIRNSIVLMINAPFFRDVKSAADSAAFLQIVSVSDDQKERQRHLELAMRFLTHSLVEYNGFLDVEEYIDDGIIQLARANRGPEASLLIRETFQLMFEAEGADALKRFEGGRHLGKVGLVGLEGIACGIARNLPQISVLPDKVGFVRQKIQDFWLQPEATTLTSPGMRGTTRIQRTVPYGERWFRP